MENRKFKLVLIIGKALLIAPLVIWAVIYFGLYLGYGNFKTRDHQAFAANGIAQIQPALEMDQFFTDCRHFISYSGPGDVPIWNAVAYFGGRYELTMQVPVSIESKVTGKMIGAPQFYLNEVSTVTISPSGQVSASFSNNHTFGLVEWNTVVAAKGDFAAIGFPINIGPPVNGFAAYAGASR